MDQRNTRKIKQLIFSKSVSDVVDENVLLWRAVLDQSLDDYRYRHKLNRRQKKEIELWVNADNRDFQQVCELACLDYEKVIKVFYHGIE